MELIDIVLYLKQYEIIINHYEINKNTITVGPNL